MINKKKKVGSIKTTTETVITYICLLLILISTIYLGSELFSLKDKNQDLTHQNIKLSKQLENTTHTESYCKKVYDRLEMWKPDHLNKSLYILNGMYRNGKYYCSWTANRTTEELEYTNTHEICHALVYRDKGHFCKYEQEKDGSETIKKLCYNLIFDNQITFREVEK